MVQFKAWLKLLFLAVFCFVSVIGTPVHHRHHHGAAAAGRRAGSKRSHFSKMHWTWKTSSSRVNHGSSRGPRKHLVNPAAEDSLQITGLPV
uniref:Uncharacterized protein n=1 Tax=Kalanchoe fedtschenkoi TaxID=63787 RepID=A0A7N0U5C4_KALFE